MRKLRNLCKSTFRLLCDQFLAGVILTDVLCSDGVPYTPYGRELPITTTSKFLERCCPLWFFPSLPSRIRAVLILLGRHFLSSRRLLDFCSGSHKLADLAHTKYRRIGEHTFKLPVQTWDLRHQSHLANNYWPTIYSTLRWRIPPITIDIAPLDLT